ncbi:MAG: hypothetical protein WC987_01485 [Mariniphaga sp.]|jgi:hypothetical protein
MVYHFIISSPESKNFSLRVEINGNQTFYDLHNIIQESLNYESYQLASFFLSDESGKKLKEISQMDQGINGSPYYIMKNTKLSDIIQSKEQRLKYTFDFFNDRSFYIKLSEIDMEKNLRESFLVRQEGTAPLQMLGADTAEEEQSMHREEEILMDFGILDDYTKLYGEMEDF